MHDLPPAARLLSTDPGRTDDTVVLDYDARLMRRKRLVTVQGAGFLVDLPAVTNLDSHWGFELQDGSCIRIRPADENVLLITGDLARLAWHIGNRHTPCEIHETYLLIREDHVLEKMLRGLGARITRVSRPFAPESGAYGTGRTMGHDHGGHDHGDHGHSHGAHTHGAHDHGHGHSHGGAFHTHDHHSRDSHHHGHVDHHGAHFHGGEDD